MDLFFIRDGAGFVVSFYESFPKWFHFIFSSCFLYFFFCPLTFLRIFLYFFLCLFLFGSVILFSFSSVIHTFFLSSVLYSCFSLAFCLPPVSFSFLSPAIVLILSVVMPHLFRCVLAPLSEGLSVRRSVGRSVPLSEGHAFQKMKSMEAH